MFSMKAPMRVGAIFRTLFLFALVGVMPMSAQAEGTVDTDLDHLTDEQESLHYGTHPMMADSDGDGLDDGQEVIDHATNPLDLDTDDDGYSDGWEVAAGSSPLTPAAPYVPDGVNPGGGGGGGDGGAGGGGELPEFIPEGGAWSCIVEPDECIPIMRPEIEEET